MHPAHEYRNDRQQERRQPRLPCGEGHRQCGRSSRERPFAHRRNCSSADRARQPPAYTAARMAGGFERQVRARQEFQRRNPSWLDSVSRYRALIGACVDTGSSNPRPR